MIPIFTCGLVAVLALSSELVNKVEALPEANQSRSASRNLKSAVRLEPDTTGICSQAYFESAAKCACRMAFVANRDPLIFTRVCLEAFDYFGTDSCDPIDDRYGDPVRPSNFKSFINTIILNCMDKYPMGGGATTEVPIKRPLSSVRFNGTYVITAVAQRWWNCGLSWQNPWKWPTCDFWCWWWIIRHYWAAEVLGCQDCH